MPEYRPFIIAVSAGTRYLTPARLGLVIKKIGTDATAGAPLEIDGKTLGSLFDVMAPWRKVAGNVLGTLDLGDLLYVVPPETEFYWRGASGTTLLIEGDYVRLAPGEAMPAHLMARFETQHKLFRTYIEGTYSHGTDVKFVADAEADVIALTPKAGEVFTFDSYLMVDVANYTPSLGDLAIKPSIEDVDMSWLLEEPKKEGIDVLRCPRPPNTTDGMDPFSFVDRPFEVVGPHTVKFKVRNVKGADITPATGTSLTFTVTAVCIQKKV